MKSYPFNSLASPAVALIAGLALGSPALAVDPTPAKVTRLTPPSMLFSYNDPGTPITSRFLPGQRFDLQATVAPDSGKTITEISFYVDNAVVPGTVSLTAATVAGQPAGATIGTLRAFGDTSEGVHKLTVVAKQSDNSTVTADGNFEIVEIKQQGRRAKNIIILLGDGMGIAHRTAARLMKNGSQQGKANAPLAMDLFPVTGIAMTASLNSIVTDSAPGMACYSTGNKFNNNQEGVFPDDTADAFDNPRVEYMGEFLARTQGKALGIVTTADVFDATPAAFAVHTQNRGAGTGICDQYLDEAAVKANLRVLLGGGRKWFLPKSGTGNGSARATGSDYVLPAELVTGWSLPTAGSVDPNRNLIGDFQAAGFLYAPDRTTLNTIPAGTTKLLGLFSLSNMNVAKDKIDGRRGLVPAVTSTGQTLVQDYGFPDQPMLDEMTDKALQVLSRNPNGFVLEIEGASIDKQAHNMDTERWIEDTIEFDYAVEKVRQFALANPDTLVVITADHECAGANIIGASTLTDAALQARIATGGGAAQLRDGVVGTYDAAKFPAYPLSPDGYPTTTDVDYRLLVGYAANADRYEDWRTNPQPLQDSQQPFVGVPPLKTYPAGPLSRDTAGNFLVVGQVGIENGVAVHTASDIPVSALGRGSAAFTGVMDNTEVFFKAMQAAMGGAK
jgi:alkaline phosphatase